MKSHKPKSEGRMSLTKCWWIVGFGFAVLSILVLVAMTERMCQDQTWREGRAVYRPKDAISEQKDAYISQSTMKKNESSAAIQTVANIRQKLNNAVPQRSRVAYVTLLGSNSFIPGAMSMMQALKDLKTRHDRVVMHTKTLPIEIIHFFHLAGVRTRWVDYIDNPTDDETFKKYTYSSKRYWVTYTKLRAWEMIEYRKVVIIDCDVYPVINMDELKHAATPSATMVVQTPKLLNPALMVITPSISEFQSILNGTKYIVSQDGGELGFFEKYYPFHWSINHLPREYLWDVLKPYPKGYDNIKSFHMFFKKPVLKTAEKIWLVKPPLVNDAVRIRYVRDNPTEKARYSYFLKVTNNFWNSYYRFWRNKDMTKQPWTKTHSLAGFWEMYNSTPNGTELFIRQHMGRIFLLHFKQKQPWVGEGFLINGTVMFYLQSVATGEDTFFTGVVEELEMVRIVEQMENTGANDTYHRDLDKNRLVMSLYTSNGKLLSQFTQKHDVPSTPLRSEIPLTGFWKGKQNMIYWACGSDGFILMFGFDILGTAVDAPRNEVKDSFDENGYRLDRIWFLREGHAAGNAMHGTYLTGFGIIFDSQNEKTTFGSDQIVLELTDNKELVPYDARSSFLGMHLKKVDFNMNQMIDDIPGTTNTNGTHDLDSDDSEKGDDDILDDDQGNEKAHNNPPKINNIYSSSKSTKELFMGLSRILKSPELMGKQIFSLIQRKGQAEKSSKTSKSTKGKTQPDIASQIHDYRGLHRGCLRFTYEFFPTFANIQMGQYGRRLVFHENRPAISTTRFGIGHALKSGLLIEWFDYNVHAQDRWSALVQDRDVVYLHQTNMTHADASEGTIPKEHLSIYESKEKHHKSILVHMRAPNTQTALMKKESARKISAKDGKDIRSGRWASSLEPQLVYTVVFSHLGDRMYLIRTTKGSDPSAKVGLGTGPVSSDGTRAQIVLFQHFNNRASSLSLVDLVWDGESWVHVVDSALGKQDTWIRSTFA